MEALSEQESAVALETSLHRHIAGQPIVCFANDWRGDPTSKHHIMRTLAAHTEVLWVESSGMRRPGLTLADGRRILDKLRRARSPVTAATGPVRVISPLSVPLPGWRLAERANARLYRRALAGAGVVPGGDPAPLLWVYTPTVAPYLAGIERAGLVYHCVDRWWAFGEYDEAVMRAHHVALCRGADVVFASSEELVRDCAAFTDDVHLVRHGVDWAHFARAALDPPGEPADLVDVRGPVLGFFGLIHDWIDQALLVRVADAFPDATLVLIGKTRVEVGELSRRPNVRLLGQKSYDDLPAYAARFHVGLIPFVLNELTRAVNPIKLREYLSAGVPVVSTALPELAVYEGSDRVRIAGDADAFIAAIGQLLARRDTPEARAAAARRMVGESWLGRCEQMVRLWRDAAARPRS